MANGTGILDLGVPSNTPSGGITTVPEMPDALRPLNRGEYRQNEDGSRSTEISLTEKIDGHRTNIPSLWMSGGLIIELSPDDAVRPARLWQQSSGKSFPRFESMEAAVTAAKARSDRGGVGSGSLAKPVK